MAIKRVYEWLDGSPELNTWTIFLNCEITHFISAINKVDIHQSRLGGLLKQNPSLIFFLHFSKHNFPLTYKTNTPL